MNHRKSHVQQVKDLANSFGVGGCSAVPDFEFEHCCDEHDIVYATGLNVKGKLVTRFEADVELYKCMKQHARTPFGRYVLAPLGFLACRIFGGIYWRG
jgi:hypothetical protein